MINLYRFLVETASEEKLSHLEHAEDHVVNAGLEGFAHAFHNLEDVHEKLSGKGNNTTVMTKYDGSPSVIFGHHPETGKFFVATKSGWNVNPKINYSEEDINNNHGHAPGLAEKLKIALKHLKKVAPKTGVYQGDLMHSGVKSKSNPQGDIETHSGQYHFTPNTITYSTPHDSDEGKNIEKSKIGIVVHTAYTGNTWDSLKADYAPNLSHFGSHPDVHMIDNRNDLPSASMSPEQHKKYSEEIKKATGVFKSTPEEAYNAIQNENSHHSDHLKTYFNKTVREDSKPTLQGYIQHLKDVHNKRIASVKTQKAIGQKTEAMMSDLAHVENNKEHFENILKMHHHLQQAKNELVQGLSANPKYKHTIKGMDTKPEGYVVVRNNRPTKLVHRQEFSRANFLSRT